MLNKQSRTADKGLSSSLSAKRGNITRRVENGLFYGT